MIVRLLRLVLYLVIVAAVVWSVTALWIDGAGNRTLAAALGALVAAVSLAALVMIHPWTAASVAAVLRRRSDITARARAAGGQPEFAALAREGLPERPARDR